MTPLTSPLTAADAKRVSALTIGLSLDCGRFGNHRLADLSTVETTTDKALLSLQKVLLKSKTLSQINGLDYREQRWLRKISLPSYFKQGTHRIPIAMVTEVDDRLHRAADERAGLVATFRTEYPGLIEAMREPLGPLYNPHDYPSVDEVIEGFSFEWHWFELDGVPTKLEQMNGAAYSAALRRMRQSLARLVAECQIKIAADGRAVIAEVLHRMAGKTGEKPKQFRQSTLLKEITEYLRTYEFRNVTDFPQLTTEISKLRQIMEGVDIENVKTDEAARAAFQAELLTVGKAVDGLLVERGVRSIKLEA